MDLTTQLQQAGMRLFRVKMPNGSTRVFYAETGTPGRISSGVGEVTGQVPAGVPVTDVNYNDWDVNKLRDKYGINANTSKQNLDANQLGQYLTQNYAPISNTPLAPGPEVLPQWKQNQMQQQQPGAQPAGAPAQTQAPSGLTFNPSAPANYLIDSKGNFQQVTPEQYQAAKQSQGGAGAAPAGGAVAPTSGATAAQGAAPIAATDYKAQRDYLTQNGIDPAYVSALSDTQVGGLYSMALYQDMQAKADAKIAPANLSQAEMDKYLADAKAAVDPTFAVNLDIAKQDFNQALGQMTGDIAYQSSQRQEAIKAEQKTQAEQMAEAGLAYSGLRQTAEQKLKEQEKGLVRSEASQYQQKLQDLAGSFQKQYGTAALQSLNIPGLQYAGINLAPPTPYNLPTGFGSQEQAQTTAELQKQTDLQQAALGKKTTELAYNLKQPLA